MSSEKFNYFQKSSFVSCDRIQKYEIWLLVKESFGDKFGSNKF